MAAAVSLGELDLSGLDLVGLDLDELCEKTHLIDYSLSAMRRLLPEKEGATPPEPPAGGAPALPEDVAEDLATPPKPAPGQEEVGSKKRKARRSEKRKGGSGKKKRKPSRR